MVSIIIRAKNEEKWISHCLKSVFSQAYNDIEVIVVDNNSTDKTVDKVKRFDGVKILNIDHFLPGKAINLGIQESRGDSIVCLSAHCIPVNNQWLAHLVRNLEDNQVAGVYGRQEPMSFSSDLNKRDLMTVFGLDRKVQIKDSFFHNANSAFRREVWEKFPFDEEVTNIEDRVWANKVLSMGYKIVYEPEASVYHHHGIHQDADEARCRNVVSILESLDLGPKANLYDIREMNVVALIPVKGDVKYCGSRPLIEYTLGRALEAEFVDEVIVSTDNPAIAEIAQRMGAKAPFLRPPELSEDYVDIGTVLNYSFDKIEEMGSLPDLAVILEQTYPFRKAGFIDNMIASLVRAGLDSLVPVRSEYRSTWLKTESETKPLTNGFMPRQFKETPVYISLFGLGCVTHPVFLRDGRILGDRVGFQRIEDSFSNIEVRDEMGLRLAGKVIDEWWSESSSWGRP